MSLPLNHQSERARLIARQLAQQYPSASPRLIDAAADAAVHFEPRNMFDVTQIATWRSFTVAVVDGFYRVVKERKSE